MRQKLVVVFLTVALWQIDMAVSAGIAASRRPVRAKSSTAQPQPQCKGGSCAPTSQPRITQPTIIVR